MFNFFSRLRELSNHSRAAIRSRNGLLSTALGLTLVVPLALPPTALASGVSGGGFSTNSGGNNPRPVDEVYEYGKALYLGRSPGSTKINYCVKVDGETRKLRGRTLRPYRGGSQLDFANALYDCDNPEKRALLNIKREEVAYVLYYLNKRYRLDLSS